MAAKLSCSTVASRLHLFSVPPTGQIWLPHLEVSTAFKGQGLKVRWLPLIRCVWTQQRQHGSRASWLHEVLLWTFWIIFRQSDRGLANQKTSRNLFPPSASAASLLITERFWEHFVQVQTPPNVSGGYVRCVWNSKRINWRIFISSSTCLFLAGVDKHSKRDVIFMKPFLNFFFPIGFNARDLFRGVEHKCPGGLSRAVCERLSGTRACKTRPFVQIGHDAAQEVVHG